MTMEIMKKFLAGVQNIFNLLDTQLDSDIIGIILFKYLLTPFNFIDLDLLSSKPHNKTVEPKAVMNARNLYGSCMDEAGIEMDGVESVLSIVNNEFGGWPILQGSAWNESTFNLSELLLKLRKYDDGFLFSVVTATNDENSSIYDIEVKQTMLVLHFLQIILQLGQGTLGLQETEYYDNETDITVAYRQFMTDLASALTNETSTIDNDVCDMYTFEKNISQVILV